MTMRTCNVDDLCFTARALAQTHPMTAVAGRYRQRRFDEERDRQPIPELADWASTAFLVGYCLRRAEAEHTSRSAEPAASPTVETLESIATRIGDTIRSGDAATVTLLEPQMTIEALDRVIGRELDKRQEHLREQLGQDEWAELEEYIAFWVVHGYATRAAEEKPR